MNSSRACFLLLALLWLTSCTAVKEYEKMYLNDVDMQLSPGLVEGFGLNVQVYREGAAGAKGGKTGGGCGCNEP
ncbi:MAG: DUF4266 domain-containing protein [Saprospiraceae bacterium]|nr:DUF4266 domain-containing protein [Saprospiraceae bacterium]